MIFLPIARLQERREGKRQDAGAHQLDQRSKTKEMFRDRSKWLEEGFVCSVQGQDCDTGVIVCPEGDLKRFRMFPLISGHMLL